MRTSDHRHRRTPLWWWMVFCWISCTLGCLQYIPVEPVEDINRPPYIIPEQVEPQRTVVTIQKSQDPTGFTTFKVLQVREFDLQDTLSVYWLLDQGRTVQGSSRCETSVIDRPSDSTDEVRNVSFVCRIAHSDLRLQPNQTSVLEVFVSDRQPIGQLILPDDSLNWPENAQLAKWVWVLNVE